MLFGELHNHTEYSRLDGLNSVKLSVQRAKELKYDALAITDHGNIDGAFIFYDECKKQGIKPIIGCEIYISDRFDKKQNQRHCTLLCKNEIGWKNLIKIVTEANLQGYQAKTIYDRPKVTKEYVEKNKEGLICLSACSSGIIQFYLNKQKKNWSKYEAESYAEKELLFWQKVFEDDFYIEIMPLKEHYEYQKDLINLAEKHNVKLVNTSDVHYAYPEDVQIHNALLAIQYKKKIRDGVGFDSPYFYMKSKRHFYMLYKKNCPYILKEQIDNAFKNVSEVIEKCELKFKEHKNKLPLPFECDPISKIIELCMKKWEKLGINNYKNGKEYKERFDEELNLIIEKGFINYFLILYDIMVFCKEEDILVGAGRGSSAGSLIAYLLDITHVDPIEYNLLFFRFIDPSRNDLPDIDSDFEDVKREKVRRYLFQKYGKENVALISTFTKLSSKTALLDMARVYDVPLNEISKITKNIDNSKNLNVCKNEYEKVGNFAKKYPDVYYNAERIEGNVRQKGVHAAGVIVSENSLIDRVPLIEDKKTGLNVISIDGWEKLNLLKIDILGLNYLSIIKRCVDLIKEKHGKEIDVYEIKPNDKKVLRSLEKDNIGVFQFDTDLMKKLIKTAGYINSFNILCDLNCLARPGSLQSGGTKSYLEKYRGEKDIVYEIPQLKKYLSETLGEILYQEQVMLICKEIGNFKWNEVNKIRKIIGKTQGSHKFIEYADQFIEGAKVKGINEDKAKKLWYNLAKFGGYGFNKSHAIVYSLLSYWCLYFRYYYPKEYFISIVNVAKTKSRKMFGVHSLKKRGHKVLAPEINSSKEGLNISKRGNIFFGFSFIEGFGENTVKEIISKQPYTSIEDFCIRVNKRVINKAIQEKLCKIGAFRYFEKNNKKALEIISSVKKVQKRKNENQQDLFDGIEKEKEKINEIENYSKEELIHFHYELMPILYGYERLIEATDFINENISEKIVFETLENFDNKKQDDLFYIKGFCLKNEIKQSQWGEYASIQFEDEFESVKIHVPTYIFKKNQEKIWSLKNDNIIFAKVKKNYNDDLELEEVIEFNKLKEDYQKKELDIFGNELINGEIPETLYDYIKKNIRKKHILKITRLYAHQLLKKKQSKNYEKFMAFINVQDDKGNETEAIIWPDIFNDNQDWIKENEVYEFKFDEAKENKLYLGSKGKIKKI